jgi:hypothetical protein
VPVEAVNHGQQRCVENVELSPQAPATQASTPTAVPSTVIPKLRARVRFPSPTPAQSPRPAARGFFVVRTVPMVLTVTMRGRNWPTVQRLIELTG